MSRQSQVRDGDDKIGVTVAGKRHTYKPGALRTVLLGHLKDVFGAGILKDADGDGVLLSELELPIGEYTYEVVSRVADTSCVKLVPKNMPIMDGKLTCRVSRLERNSKCIGTAIRLSKKGIIMTTRLAKDDMENVKEITTFRGPLVLIRDYLYYNFCFFKGEEGEAFDIAPFRTFGVTQEVDLVSYPSQRIRNNNLHVSRGIVEDIDSTGYYGTLTLAESKESFPSGGAIVVGEKLLLGMHIGTNEHKIGKFITSWMIRHFLGEFDKRYDEPIKVPLVKRSRRL